MMSRRLQTVMDWALMIFGGLMTAGFFLLLAALLWDLCKSW